jgi:hypothetical protein
MRETVAAVSSAVSSRPAGDLKSKVAVAHIALNLIRRYPIPALCIAGLAIAFYAGRRHAQSRALRY